MNCYQFCYPSDGSCSLISNWYVALQKDLFFYVLSADVAAISFLVFPSSEASHCTPDQIRSCRSAGGYSREVISLDFGSKLVCFRNLLFDVVTYCHPRNVPLTALPFISAQDIKHAV